MTTPAGSGPPGWGPPGPADPPGQGWSSPPASTQLPSGWNPPPPSGWTPPPAGWNPDQSYGYGYPGWQQAAKRESRLPIVIILVLVIALVAAVVVAMIMLGSTLGTLTGSNLPNLAVGQCFNGGRALDTTSTTTILRTVETVECAQPHESELAASFDYPDARSDADYPGQSTVESLAETECYTRFAEYVGRPYEQSVYEMTYAYPLEFNWLLGDRSVQCIVHPPVGELTMTGSVRNSGR